MSATEPELVDMLIADGNAVTISESTATPDLDALVAERNRYYELLAEVLDDLERVVNGNPGYIDRDMLVDYRERAGLPVVSWRAALAIAGALLLLAPIIYIA